MLALATVAAFIVTQQLKGEFPLVLRFAVSPEYFSPNGDGVRDRTLVGFDLTRRSKVSFYVLDAEGHEVRRLVDDRELAGDTKHRFVWDGRDDSGKLVPDGIYRLRVARRDEGRVIESIKELTLDRKPPRVRLVSARPGVIAPGPPGQHPAVTIRYSGPRNKHPEYRIFRTDDGPPRVVLRFRGGKSRSAVWHGIVHGRPAAPGTYAFTVSVRDLAGNLSVAPTENPTARTALAGTGVAVRHISLQGPIDVVPAGSLVHLTLGPYDRSFEFALSRLGDVRPINRGERLGGRFRVRLPGRARTGVYSVRVRAGRERAVWPLFVAGLPPRRARGPRPLVVLPAITAQGLNRVDDDLDGFPDTLADAQSVRLERPLLEGASLPRFNSQVMPLLRFLDRERLAYDLTTDASLARGQGPVLGNAPGVVFAGSARWLPTRLLTRLKRYVRDGGRVASFGADAFRREVALYRGRLSDPSPRRSLDVFGERTSLFKTSSAPLDVERDRLHLFKGLDRLVGEFNVFERSTRLPEGARPLDAAGRDPGEPAFVAYRLGRGIVVRSGTPDWARELNKRRLSVDIPRVTKRIWRLLGGS